MLCCVLSRNPLVVFFTYRNEYGIVPVTFLNIAQLQRWVKKEEGINHLSHRSHNQLAANGNNKNLSTYSGFSYHYKTCYTIMLRRGRVLSKTNLTNGQIFSDSYETGKKIGNSSWKKASLDIKRWSTKKDVAVFIYTFYVMCFVTITLGYKRETNPNIFFSGKPDEERGCQKEGKAQLDSKMSIINLNKEKFPSQILNRLGKS